MITSKCAHVLFICLRPKLCNFLEWRDLKIVYKRYASLYFCMGIQMEDNELITLEIIHRSVCIGAHLSPFDLLPVGRSDTTC